MNTQMILRLIVKDHRAYRLNIVGVCAVGMVSIVVFRFTKIDGNTIGNFLNLASLFVCVSGTTFYLDEKKGRAEILAVSLPVTRKTVLLARYLTSFIVSIVTLFLLLLSLILWKHL